MPAANPDPQTSPQDSRYLETAEEIRTCFKQFRDQRSTLSICLDGTRETICCKILDVHDQTLLIEDITPRSALEKLRGNPSFSLSVRSPGVYAFVTQAEITGQGQQRVLPYFVVPLPKRMLFQQRRRDSRFRIPSRVTTQGATITLFRPNPCVGRIIDISAGGLRAEFQLPLDSPMSNDEVFANSAIAIPPVLNLNGEAVLRHRNPTKRNSVICGFELAHMHVTDRHRLEQFIQSTLRSTDQT